MTPPGIKLMMRLLEVVDGTGYIGTVTHQLVDVEQLDTSSSMRRDSR